MHKKSFSDEHIKFMKKQKIENFKVKLFQIGIIIFLIVIWELMSNFNLIDSFLISSPSRILHTIIDLNLRGELWKNVFVTILETFSGFVLGTTIGFLLAVIIWWSKFIFKVVEPYLIILNAIPKVAFGPIIIVWIGAGTTSIIIMALFVSVIISTINILSGFQNVDKNKIFLMKSFGATKLQVLLNLIIPANIPIIISTLKINVGMSLIGVITGEFLVASSGIGYLIVYGGQVFKMDLVMSGVLILAVIATLIYISVAWLENLYLKKSRH